MKIVISVQAKSASSRGLVHYVAHSKTDEEREPKTREIFSEYADALTVEKANDFLNAGTKKARPANEELHHLVISLRAEDYERLGADEKEKQKSFKEIARHTLEKLKEQVGADKLAWTAGIHRNTDNPHVHIAVQKTYFDKNLEKKTLGKIPARLLPHYEKNGDEKTFAPGILIEAAVDKMDEIILEKEKSQKEIKQKLQAVEKQKNSTDKKQQNIQKENRKTQLADEQLKIKHEKERDILVRAILAKFYLEKTRGNLESLENHGDKRRFKIYDKIISKNRQMSLFDLERRAEKSANRQIKNLNITDADKKEGLKKNLVETEMQKNADGIKRIKTILREVVVKENQTLRKREADYKQIKPLAEKIRRDCRCNDIKLPVPNLSFEDLEMLQIGSLEKKDIRTANYFERVRSELAIERGVPTRTNEEIARLKAKQTISQLKVLSYEKQLKDSSRQKRAFPIKTHGGKWSLAKVDSFTRKQQKDDQKFVGKISKALGRIGLVEHQDKLAKLEEIKTAITEKLNEKNDQLANDLKGEKSILKTIDEFYKNDTNPEKEKLEAKFSAAELAEVESFAFDLKKADVYRENWNQQKQFIENAEGNAKNPAESIAELKQETIAGRALAREILCEIELNQAKEEFALFKKHKNFQKFEVTNGKTGEATFVNLKEVEFDSRGSLFDQTLEFFIENREKRNYRRQVEKFIKEKNTELKENLKSAKIFSKIAAEETRDYKTKSFFGTEKLLQTPLFTPKELMTIELRIRQTESKSEAAKLQKILDLVDHSKAENLHKILQGFATDKEPTKAIELNSDNEQQLTVNSEKENKKTVEKNIEIRESKTEIFNQEKGR